MNIFFRKNDKGYFFYIYTNDNKRYIALSNSDMEYLKNPCYGLKVNDCFKFLHVLEDRCQIIDFEKAYYLEAGQSKINVDVTTFPFPKFIWKVLYRYFKTLSKRLKTYDECGSYGEDVFSFVIPERFFNRYGNGKGDVEIVENLKKEDILDEDFGCYYNNIVNMAKNSTKSSFENAKVYFTYNYDKSGLPESVSWAAYNPKNKPIMNGCIVNHGDCWSSHT